MLLSAEFETGDSGLDTLLNTAKTKYLDPDAVVRQEGLEKLWDAWERLKTIEPGSSKRASTAALLDRVATGPEIRELFGDRSARTDRRGQRVSHSTYPDVEDTPRSAAGRLPLPPNVRACLVRADRDRSHGMNGGLGGLVGRDGYFARLKVSSDDLHELGARLRQRQTVGRDNVAKWSLILNPFNPLAWSTF